MCLRFYSKRVSKNAYFLDDYVLILSWGVATIFVCITLWMTRIGLGCTLTLGNRLFSKGVINERFKFIPFLTFVAISACWVSKLSFFITPLRLVPGRWQKVILWLLMTTSTVSLIILSILMSFIECNKERIFRLTPSGDFIPVELPHCIEPQIVEVLGMFSSVYATAMLKMPRHEKATIICAMSTGCFAGGVSILKVIKTYEVIDASIEFPRWSDPWEGGLVCALASVEVSCTIIAASIPFFRPLIRRLMAKAEGTPEEPVAMSAIASSCRGHVRLERASNSYRKRPSNDNSIA
ncbi:hypothetical protein SMAC4_13824 [Sordaria macrospora]|uniref:uncharacterized protein n=1 Tax=Sordaria macrospora TaxID=5147 RepID=UPI002B2E7E7C|nr:hypothetical protein SMAC4_13824 [Sordaria macrospora]